MRIMHVLWMALMTWNVTQMSHATWVEPDQYAPKETLACLMTKSDLLVIGHTVEKCTEVGTDRFYVMQVDQIIATTWPSSDNDKHLETLLPGTCIQIRSLGYSNMNFFSGFQYLCWLKVHPLSIEQKKGLRWKTSVFYDEVISNKGSIQVVGIPESPLYAIYLQMLKTENPEMAKYFEENAGAEYPKKLKQRIGLENLTAAQVLQCTKTIAKFMSAEKNHEAELAKLAKSDDPLMACTASFLLSNHKDKIQRFQYVERTPAINTAAPDSPKKEPQAKTKITLREKGL